MYQKKTLFFPNNDSFITYHDLLKQTQKRLLLCMYQITHQQLIKTLITLSKKYIEIFIITHLNEDDQRQKIVLNKLTQKTNYSIKIALYQHTQSLMHCKFCVIDDQYVLAGSANWTLQGFTNNCEFVTIINNNDSISEFADYFFTVWKQCQEVTFIGQTIKHQDISYLDTKQLKKNIKLHQKTKEIFQIPTPEKLSLQDEIIISNINSDESCDFFIDLSDQPIQQ